MKGEVVTVSGSRDSITLIVRVQLPVFTKEFDLIDKRERSKLLQTEEYKQYEKSLEALKREVGLGSVEITYINGEGNEST